MTNDEVNERVASICGELVSVLILHPTEADANKVDPAIRLRRLHSLVSQLCRELADVINITPERRGSPQASPPTEADEGLVMACLRVSDVLVPPLETATQVTCAECGCKLWIAPEGLKVVERQHGRTMCMPCIDSHVTDDTAAMMSLGQAKELNQALMQMANEKRRLES